MDQSSERLVAIVTGAADGVGRRTVLRLSAQGHDVVAADLNGAGLARTAEFAQRSNATGGRVVCVEVDVADDPQVRRLVDTAVETFGRLDKVANVAGYAIRKSFRETDLEDWRRMIDINLTSVFSLCQAASAAMPAGGAVVNVSSVGGFVGMGYAAYNAAKGGVIGLSKMIATELAPAGIRVNVVAPGPLATAFTESVRENPDIERAVAGATLVKRFGQADEIAAAIEFLLSDDASFITGHVLVVDGGMTSTVNLGQAAAAYQTAAE